MKKLMTSLIFIGSFGAYALYHNFSNSAPSYVATDTTQPLAITAVTPTVTPKPIVPTPQSPAKPPTPPVRPKPKGQYADGTYTGTVADAYYGNVQVQIVISGGRLSTVTFLDHPSDRNTSRFINNRAMPILQSEAISAQSANVNTVSGATDTSGAFRESLASALTQAGN